MCIISLKGCKGFSVFMWIGLQALWQTLQLLPLLNLFVTILAFETAIATTNLKF